MEAVQRHDYSVQEYFSLEKESQIRHEFYKGELYAMAGTSLNHNEIVQNVALSLRSEFRPKGCRVFSENVKLEVVKDIYYPYPDIVLTCHADDMTANYVISQPSLIVEVLSQSTEKHDRGFKWLHYQRMSSLKHFMLVTQDECRIELYSRNGHFWRYEAFDSMEQTIRFEHLAFELAVSAVYETITFVPPGNEGPELVIR